MQLVGRKWRLQLNKKSTYFERHEDGSRAFITDKRALELCHCHVGMISLLRPLDLVESLVLQRGRRWDEEPYRHLSPLFDQHPLSTGLVALLQVHIPRSIALSEWHTRSIDIWLRCRNRFIIQKC